MFVVVACCVLLSSVACCRLLLVFVVVSCAMFRLRCCWFALFGVRWRRCYSWFVCCGLVAFSCDVSVWLLVCIMCSLRLFVLFVVCVFPYCFLMAFVECCTLDAGVVFWLRVDAIVFLSLMLLFCVIVVFACCLMCCFLCLSFGLGCQRCLLLVLFVSVVVCWC